MSPKQLWLPELVSKQSNALSRARFVSGSEVGLKVAVVIGSMIEKTTTVLEEYVISPNILYNYNLGGNRYANMRKVMEDIASTRISILEGKKYKVYPLFGVAQWDDETKRATVSLNPKLLNDHYLIDHDFTLLPTMEIRDLRGTPAQMIYQHLMSWNDKPETAIKLSEMFHKLGPLYSTPKEIERQKADFSRFQDRILDPVYDQIRQKTTLKYEWETIRSGKGNKVQMLRFVFTHGLMEKLSDPAYRFNKLPGKKKEPFLLAFEKQFKNTPLAVMMKDRDSDEHRRSFNKWIRDVLETDAYKDMKLPR